ncbi:MAG: hypothetical protein MK192_03665, partial [Idiomarina sp.]|nr:hypothetical protein [Idiomarina sp.]
MEHGSYLGLGKKICQVLISGEWHILPVSVLKSYERRDELLYRCHSCKKKISLHRASHDGKPAHFEHDPFNKNCVLRFTRNEENRKVHVSDESEHSFRFNPITHFGLNRSP